MAMAIVNIIVEVDLAEFATSDLIAELRARGKNMDVKAILSNLKAAGCPADLLSNLQAWAATPILTAEMLESWKQSIAVAAAK